MKKLILATNNNGKVNEFKKILEPLGYEILSLKQAEIEVSPDENGQTFEENSLIKARAVFEIAKEKKIENFAVIADDSGLEVDYLPEKLGVHSARYGGDVSYTQKNIMVLDELKNVDEKNRTARFIAVISYISNDCEMTFRGECEGKIGFEARGENGFGYDPIFYVGEKSFAEIKDDEKNKISHRALALKKLIEYLKGEI